MRARHLLMQQINRPNICGYCFIYKLKDFYNQVEEPESTGDHWNDNNPVDWSSRILNIYFATRQ